MVQYFIAALLRISDVAGGEVLMLPLAYSVGVSINLIVLWSLFHFEFREFSKCVLRTLSQIFSVSVFMGYVAYLGLSIFGTFFDLDTTIGIFLQGFCAGIVAIIVGGILLRLMQSIELSEMWQTLHRKIWKASVIVPEQKELVQ
jgi:hypothetical protein